MSWVKDIKITIRKFKTSSILFSLSAFSFFVFNEWILVLSNQNPIFQPITITLEMEIINGALILIAFGLMCSCLYFGSYIGEFDTSQLFIVGSGDEQSHFKEMRGPGVIN